jgi:predicted nuclease with TOPRIM domain
MDIEAVLRQLQARVEYLGATVNTLSLETSVLQELCAALMAELAILSDRPSERLEQIIADEQQVSYQVASDMDDHGDDMWDILVDHAEIRNRAFDHARMALARILGHH